VLVLAALRGLECIYRPGFEYKKAGVMAALIPDKANRQVSLFDDFSEHDGRSAKLMATMDSINARFGQGSLRVASEGRRCQWAARAERLSPQFTTRWDELPVAG